MNAPQLFIAVHAVDPSMQFRVPASRDGIEAVERALEVRLPRPLRDLLERSDGMFGDLAPGLLWSLDQMLAENSRMRDPQFDALSSLSQYLFFADCEGYPFGMTVDASGEVHDPVIVWNPIADEIRLGADSIEDYFERWLGGRLSI